MSQYSHLSNVLFNMAGLTGVLLTLIAYLLLNIEKISSDALSYLSMNALGSMLILLSVVNNWNLAAFVMELCWLLLSLYGIYKSSIKSYLRK